MRRAPGASPGDGLGERRGGRGGRGGGCGGLPRGPLLPLGRRRSLLLRAARALGGDVRGPGAPRDGLASRPRPDRHDPAGSVRADHPQIARSVRQPPRRRNPRRVEARVAGDAAARREPTRGPRPGVSADVDQTHAPERPRKPTHRYRRRRRVFGRRIAVVHFFVGRFVRRALVRQRVLRVSRRAASPRGDPSRRRPRRQPRHVRSGSALGRRRVRLPDAPEPSRVRAERADRRVARRRARTHASPRPRPSGRVRGGAAGPPRAADGRGDGSRDEPDHAETGPPAAFRRERPQRAERGGVRARAARDADGEGRRDDRRVAVAPLRPGRRAEARDVGSEG